MPSPRPNDKTKSSRRLELELLFCAVKCLHCRKHCHTCKTRFSRDHPRSLGLSQRGQEEKKKHKKKDKKKDETCFLWIMVLFYDWILTIIGDPWSSNFALLHVEDGSRDSLTKRCQDKKKKEKKKKKDKKKAGCLVPFHRLQLLG